MPRKAHLEPHLSSTQLKHRYRHCREPVESRRWHLLWLVSQNWQIKAAAAAVGLNYDYAKDIVQAYNQQGIESMANQRKQPGRRGRTPLLCPTQLSELQQALRQPPADGGVWSGPKVARWIAHKTGSASVRAQRGWDYLQRCRFTRTAPSPSSC